ncbi:ribosomal protein S15 [Sphaceloma murrayae]|uniref:Ribosomal protein S15 n=1 Tax=Sphaceloma murrayae TaxID=2082308 RepID=A0A2K1R3V0_9PEZI|nr:ribosomal protein S15 [Sphaceloma murrayae]
MDALLLRLGDLSLRSSRQTCNVCRKFSSSSVRSTVAKTERRRFRDPYTIVQAKARKEANISRRSQLIKERKDALGDPVRGKSTPFIESFDTAAAPAPSASRSSAIPYKDAAKTTNSKALEAPASNDLNFDVASAELDSSLSRSLIWSGSRIMHRPEHFIEEFKTSSGKMEIKEPDLMNPDPGNKYHVTATEAMRRITSLANSSSKDRLRVNIRRCISTFGRHETDKHLPPKPSPSANFLASQSADNALPEKTPRAGPDTGSSEVQIAVLTARIRTLSEFLDGRGKMDKMNKRNLRLLVHKRQKLLRYLERKERGGPRFRNVVEVLGLERGAWEGEITLR